MLERQMKAECEIAMKLMEKDVHEKQDTIISLRLEQTSAHSILIRLWMCSEKMYPNPGYGYFFKIYRFFDFRSSNIFRFLACFCAET